MPTTASTSLAAKIAVGPVARNIRARVFRYLLDKAGVGAIDEEIQHALGVKGSTARTRRKELEKRGLVENSGRVRSTTSGRSSVVWVVPVEVRRKAMIKLGELRDA
jgi:predicted transcriptional regulator